MSVSFSTDDVSPAERDDYWQHIARRYHGHDIRFPHSGHDWFRARSVTRDLGTATITTASITADPAWTTLEAHRTPRRLHWADTDAYEVKLLRHGVLYVVAQDGREAALRPGDFALADMERPRDVAMAAGGHQEVLTLLVPRTQLPLPSSELALLTAVRLSGQEGSGSLISALLRGIAAEQDTYDPAESVRISSAVLDLLTAALAGRLDRRASIPDKVHHRALVQRIYAFMESHLGNSALSPRAVADAHHISLRYLHKLFEAEECTVAEWIRLRRLEQCRRDLTDVTLLNRPVSAIAARWGFADTAHFTRLFRTTHGMAPGAYRMLHTRS
ncbi:MULTISPECIES: helix-turn-helix domain-containing protein [Streptomyces]|uniref:Helix-turn-helix domain-containing protein n=1 Tax=Streptomyces spinosisporus TaxID=2927582 RepID=A0ABS9XN40_9ACTN|nr:MULTISPECIES: helix-turn-helix domain-containing protein [Streptomyces]EPD63828.1 hypothetical protein HMPREF1211_02955 [Streptomyces sp. HGB0020]MCI3243494.1 helix-turn-helix domain-containing protein [Streptomyces spinosisporus]